MKMFHPPPRRGRGFPSPRHEKKFRRIFDHSPATRSIHHFNFFLSTTRFLRRLDCKNRLHDRTRKNINTRNTTAKIAQKRGFFSIYGTGGKKTEKEAKYNVSDTSGWRWRLLRLNTPTRHQHNDNNLQSPSVFYAHRRSVVDSDCIATTFVARWRPKNLVIIYHGSTPDEWSYISVGRELD